MTTKHEEIADTLAEEILAGQYRPGERLPSERDLAGRFSANRGAVREAMKLLAHLGLATIAPGGARANDLGEASLDVLGYLLARGQLPDAKLTEQILEVINALVVTAIENVMDSGNVAQLEAIRATAHVLVTENLNDAQHLEARTALFREIMVSSDNLVCRLIARTLFEQLAPRVADFAPFVHIDQARYRDAGGALYEALGRHDKLAVREALHDLSAAHRASVGRALEAARESKGYGTHATANGSLHSATEVSASSQELSP